MNQEEGLTLTRLDGLPGMSIQALKVPVGWPTETTLPANLQDYFVFTELQKMIFQAPNDAVCTNGNTVKFTVNEDLFLMSVCEEGNSTSIGTWMISYKDDKFVFSMKIAFDASAAINLDYVIDGPSLANFNDIYSDPEKIATPKVDVVLEVVS